jgi:hypothetical protein
VTEILPRAEWTRTARLAALRLALRQTLFAGASLVALAALIAIAVLAVRKLDAPATSEPTSNVVVTVSGPSGSLVPRVSVYANGTATCQTTPCTLSTLAPGVHFVQVIAPGYAQSATRAIVVEDRRPVSVHFELEREAAHAAPDPQPQPVSVAPAPAPIETAAALESWPEETTARPAAPLRAAAPPPVVPSKGILTLISVPSSNVVVDGKPLGSTPKRVRVDAGQHSVLFVHPEHGRAERSVSVAAGANQSVSVRF